MSNNELLLAISKMMDDKLKPIYVRLDKIEARLDGLEVRMDRLETRMDRLEARMDQAELDIKKIQVTQENEILPRLQNIEACYTSTYNRYARGVEKMEQTTQDIGLMKTVIIEHSDKLHKMV